MSPGLFAETLTVEKPSSHGFLSILLSVCQGKEMQPPEFPIGFTQVTERGLFFYVQMIKYYIRNYWNYVD